MWGLPPINPSSQGPAERPDAGCFVYTPTHPALIFRPTLSESPRNLSYLQTFPPEKSLKTLHKILLLSIYFEYHHACLLSPQRGKPPRAEIGFPLFLLIPLKARQSSTPCSICALTPFLPTASPPPARISEASRAAGQNPGKNRPRTGSASWRW